MAHMWKSQNGYIKLRDMEVGHLANAWATILRKIHDNSMLPESLVKAAERDYYDGELLQDLCDAPTPTLRVWFGHLSPVKDIKIFLQGTPIVSLYGVL
jgi:hypothetical protein